MDELKSLAANIDHIKEIVAMQQSYARVLGVVESLPVADLVEDALRLNAGAMERHQVKVIREYFAGPAHPGGQAQSLQILVNLIRNAKYALDDRGHEDKRLVLQVGLNGDDRVKISVIDNGIGIPPEHLTRDLRARLHHPQGRPRLRPAQRRPGRQRTGRLPDRAQRRPGQRRPLHP